MGKFTAARNLTLGLGIGTIGVLAAIKRRDERYIQGIRNALNQAQPSNGVFSEQMVDSLPDPARRYFLHAIQPGTPLASRLRWHYTGQMKPGAELPWMPLEAEQLLVERHGFVWKAKARKGPLVITATDHYLDGDGRMRITLFGLIPIINVTGPDLSKSAMARLLIEGMALPSAFLPGPHVQIEGIDASRFTVTTNLHGETTPITVTVDSDGRPTEVTMQRWSNLTADGSYQYIPYGVTIGEERTVGGYTIPAQMAGGWWYGTKRYIEVMRLNVDWAQLD